MNSYMKSIVPIVEAKYDSLTNAEKNIADFFLTNRDKIDFSAQNVAKKIFVSEASLSRFAKKCGFHGYREFKYQYEKTFAGKSEVVTGNTKKVLNAYQELLNKTYSFVDEAQIARIVNYLFESERVFVCGKGSSGIAAGEMESRFMRIGVDIDSLQDTDRMRMQSVFLNKRYLVCGLTLSGKTPEVLYLLREAHKRGAKTVLFTANDKDVFADFCDEVVLVASLNYLQQGNVISPQFPHLVMLDIIYSFYINSEKYEKAELYGDTLRALKPERVHIT